MSNGYPDSIPFILKSREETKAVDSLEPQEGKACLDILETSSSLGYKILGSAAGERQEDSSERGCCRRKAILGSGKAEGVGGQAAVCYHCPLLSA